MDNTSASRNPEYLAAKRRYVKAHAAIAGAHDHLARTAGDDDYPTLLADELLAKVAKVINAEFTALEKRLGVRVYRPYGYRR